MDDELDRYERAVREWDILIFHSVVEAAFALWNGVQNDTIFQLKATDKARDILGRLDRRGIAVLKNGGDEALKLLEFLQEYAARPGYGQVTEANIKTLKESICHELDIPITQLSWHISSIGALHHEPSIRHYISKEAPVPPLPCYRVTYRDRETGKAGDVYLFDRDLRLVSLTTRSA